MRHVTDLGHADCPQVIQLQIVGQLQPVDDVARGVGFGAEAGGELGIEELQAVTQYAFDVVLVEQRQHVIDRIRRKLGLGADRIQVDQDALPDIQAPVHL